MLKVVKGAIDFINSISDSGDFVLQNGCGSGDWKLDFTRGVSVKPYCGGKTRRSEVMDVFQHRTRRAGTPIEQNGALGKAKGFLTTLKQNGFSFPLLEDPMLAMGIITGKTVVLVRFDSPVLKFQGSFRKDFHLPPFPPVSIFFEGTIDVEIKIAAVYDTSGIQKAIKQKNPLLALDGFGIVTENADGSPFHQMIVTGSVGVGGQLNAGVAKAAVGGRFGITVGLGLIDPAGDDGLLRVSELITVFRVKGVGGFKYLFRIDVELWVSVFIYVKVFALVKWVTVFQKEWKFTIFTWSYVPDLILKIANQKADGELVIRFDNAQNWITGNNFAVKLTHISGSAGFEKLTISVAATNAIDNPTDVNDLIEFTFDGVTRISGDASSVANKNLLLILAGVISETNVKAGPSLRHVLRVDFSASDGGVSGFLDPPQVQHNGAMVLTGMVLGAGLSMHNFATVEILLGDDDDAFAVHGCAQGTMVSIFGGTGGDDIYLGAPPLLSLPNMALEHIKCALAVDAGEGHNSLIVDLTQSKLRFNAEWDVETLTWDSQSVLFAGVADVEVQLPAHATNTGPFSSFILKETPPSVNSTFAINGGGHAEVVLYAQGVLRPLSMRITKADKMRLKANAPIGSITETLVQGLGLPHGNLSLGSVGFLILELTSQADTFSVISNNRDLVIFAGNADDKILVFGTSGPLSIFGGAGNDQVEVIATTGGVLGRVMADGETGTDRVLVNCSALSSLDVVAHRAMVDIYAKHTTSGSYWFTQDMLNRQGSFQTLVTRPFSGGQETISYDQPTTLFAGYQPTIGNSFFVEYTDVATTIEASDAADDLFRVGLFRPTQSHSGLYTFIERDFYGDVLPDENKFVSRGNAAPLTIHSRGGNDTVWINANEREVVVDAGDGDNDQLHLRSFTNSVSRPCVSSQAVRLSSTNLCWFGHGLLTYYNFEHHVLQFRSKYLSNVPITLVSTAVDTTTLVLLSGRFDCRADSALLDGTVTVSLKPNKYHHWRYS